jgi:dolichol-phosphate mannosyltransferase
VREDGRRAALKRLTSRWFYRLLDRISDTSIVEGAADFRLLSRRVVELFQRRVRERGLFLRGLVSWVGFRSLAVRFEAQPRRGGRTKFPLRNMMRFGAEGVVAFSRSPARGPRRGTRPPRRGHRRGGRVLAGMLLRGSSPGRGPASALVPAPAGLNLLFLGVLGEYVASVLVEVRARPHYVVEERINLPPIPDGGGPSRDRPR